MYSEDATKTLQFWILTVRGWGAKNSQTADSSTVHRNLERFL